jgi:TRAP-type mannitol/chloroaromatic compound transport system substrate-binding protein
MAITRRAALAAISAALAAPAITGRASAQARHRWRIQGYLPASFGIQQDFAAWCEALGAKSDSALAIEAVPVGAVVGPTETVDAIRNGVLTGHFSGPPYFAGKDQAFAIIGDTSAAYDDVHQRDRWWSEGGGLDFTRRLYAGYDIHCVGPVFSLAEWLPSKVPLDGVESLRGMKIRAPQGIISELFAHFGAGVVVLPGTEVFNALETGIVDAADWAWLALNEQTGLHRVCPYAIYAPHSMGVTDLSISAREWDRLSDDLRSLIDAETTAFSDMLRDKLEAGEVEAEARLTEAGITLTRWPEEERRKIRAAQVEIWDRLAGTSAMAAEAVESHRAFMRQIGLQT